MRRREIDGASKHSKGHGETRHEEVELGNHFCFHDDVHIVFNAHYVDREAVERWFC